MTKKEISAETSAETKVQITAAPGDNVATNFEFANTRKIGKKR